jgi:hypothetical protein
MSLPVINVTVSLCSTHSCPTSVCGCPVQSSEPVQHLPEANVPCNTEGCADYPGANCILWPGPDIALWGIKKGDPLTKVITVILQAFANNNLTPNP